MTRLRRRKFICFGFLVAALFLLVVAGVERMDSRRRWHRGVAAVAPGWRPPLTNRQESPSPFSWLWSSLRRHVLSISTDVTDVRFLLWTRENTAHAQNLPFVDASAVNGTHFSANRAGGTVFLMHGFADTGDTGWIRNVAKELLIKNDYNVISVEWSKLSGSGPADYPIAVNNVQRVAVHTADFILNTLMDAQVGMKGLEEIPLVVGFSLGAHVAGCLGNAFEGRLSRITGLDPAGFLWLEKPANKKLSRKSARFVDVIRSAGGDFIGTDKPVGHVDFYPNGGRASQPGCRGKEGFGLDCSHQRANKLYAESINSDVGFKAYRCPSWKSFKNHTCRPTGTNMMGFPASPASPGVFYLKTNAKPPFAIPAPSLPRVDVIQK